MRAVIVKEAGGPEVLQLEEVEDPRAGPGEVRVRVRAAGVNRADLLQRMGLYPAPRGVRQDVLGMEFAGEVESLGVGSDGWKVGDRVMGIAPGAAQAELVVAHERMLLRIPDALDFAAAAAVPEAFLTAHDALYRQGSLAPGEAVLVHAAGSGVGTAAVQLAAAGGSRTIGTSRSPRKLEHARELGLGHGLVVERGAGFSKAVRELTGGEGVRLIADFVGGPYLDENLRSLAVGGRLVVIGLLGGAKAEIDLSRLMTARLHVMGTTLRSRAPEEKMAVTQAFARQGLPLLAAGKIRAIVDRVLPASEVRAAHELLAKNDTFGKLVLAF
ncbi:MAG TPA: NAD(P)H-quinone oxidoreductase [Myxococcales bacterium]|nr:NAD(P)H-quinone oxidoreductase [Myxococcales bacterium]